MPKVILTLLVLLLFFSSCTKDEGKIPIKNAIIYKDFGPNLVLNSVTGTVTIYSGNDKGVISSPLDTSCAITICLDNSCDLSFSFQALHQYMPWIGGSSLNGKYYQGLSVFGNNALDSFAVRGSWNSLSEGTCLKYFHSGDPIKNWSYYSPSKGAYFRRAGIFYSCEPFIGESYIVFKTFRAGVINYGWIRVESIGVNGVKIKEAAFNSLPNKDILCEQKN